MSHSAQDSGLYAIPPGVDFAKVFADGFFERFAAVPPESIGRIRILAIPKTPKPQYLMQEFRKNVSSVD